ncbi:MAG: hypothetical protein KatS3mg101_0628 [Patescibacteria group bacterium]|nr:MAG: hypothetical protein KatS3mg101_0628 [Patescibacteria group bacterium]
MKNIKLAFALLLGFVAIFISFYNWTNLKKIEAKLQNLEQILGDIKSFKERDVIPETSVPVTDQEIITFTGTLRKEEVPAELELGDYWYWIYFDEPYRLEQNAAGFPMDVTKLQVNPPKSEEFNIDAFDGQHVEIKGYITWGYAESSVIQAEEIVKK